MVHFDEARLVRELADLSGPARIAFACAAATRQIGVVEHARSSTAHSLAVRNVTLQLWQELNNPGPAWPALLAQVMAAIPQEGDVMTLRDALVDDALSSLAYAIRCLLTRNPQEAAWAARRAYEAADQIAMKQLGLLPRSPVEEAKVLGHPVVQMELARQREDLSQLAAGGLDEVRNRAFAAQLLPLSGLDSIEI